MIYNSNMQREGYFEQRFQANADYLSVKPLKIPTNTIVFAGTINHFD